MFSLVIGLAFVAFGAAVVVYGQGVQPCGKFCGLQQSVVQLFGQSAHNSIFGALWIALGAVLVVAVWRRKRPMRGDNDSGPQV